MAKELPMLYKLGETRAEVHVTNAKENKDIALSLASQARHSIDIFTQDMDAEIYNNKEFEESIVKLARRHPKTSIRILVQDPKKAAQNGHCLVRLAQSLTSSVFIHTLSREYQDKQCAFMVVDNLGLIYRISAIDRNYETSVNFMSPQRARELTDIFNEAWEHSTPDVQTRRIYM